MSYLQNKLKIEQVDSRQRDYRLFFSIFEIEIWDILVNLSNFCHSIVWVGDHLWEIYLNLRDLSFVQVLKHYAMLFVFTYVGDVAVLFNR